MAAYKDEERGTWYVSFYYEDWTGAKKRKVKRGFRTKKEALNFEAEYKRTAKADMDMTMGEFVEVYFRDKSQSLKDRSIKNKRDTMNAQLLPYFKDRPMNSITPAEIIQWQNTIIEKGYSDDYLKTIQNQMTALFNHAKNIYNLADNPCDKVKRMGKTSKKKMKFWTIEEYRQFMTGIEPGSKYYVLFELLFWTGAREGEALSITPADIDFERNLLHINKTYYRMHGEDVITSPKTEESNRTISIPEFLKKEIQDYISRLYELPEDERIFPMVHEAVQHKLKQVVQKTGVKKIRVHDIRHSHAAFLINKGVQFRADIQILKDDKEQAIREKQEAEQRAEDAEKELKSLEDRRNVLQPIMDNASKEIKEYGMIKTFLPEAGTFERAVPYRENKIKPLFIKMKNQIAALAGKVVELNKMVESWKNKYQKSVEECDNIQKQLDDVRKENGKLSNDNQRLQEISDRYDRVVRILGTEVVEDV